MTGPAPAELVLTTGPAANGGSCVSRHDGRVVFVRYALPGEVVRARVTAERGSYWHAEVIEVLEPSPDRIDPLCPIAAGPPAAGPIAAGPPAAGPIAGVDGAGCCDLAFAEPAAIRSLKGGVVANQLARLADYQWEGQAEPVGAGEARGWRSRVRLAVGGDGRAGFHRYHSAELVTDLRCGQLAAGLLDGIDERRWRPGDQIHVVLDDDGQRHVVTTSRGRRGMSVVDGAAETVQRVGERAWRLPVTGFWQSHRDAAATYSAVVRDWAVRSGADLAWDLYGGAGLFAGALADALGGDAVIVTVDTAKAASASARSALADLPGVQVVSDSARKFLIRQSGSGGAGIAVLDPPRAGAGREVIDLLAGHGVGTVIHIGCEAAAFARDIGLYRGHGYRVDSIRVFDAFPLTHHVECIALLTNNNGGVP